MGKAMSAGRRKLEADAFRGKVFGAGKLELQDWFVPVLYQEKEDVQLLTGRKLRSKQRKKQKQLTDPMGALPPEPDHGFVGRSRELLALERLSAQEKVNYAVVVGQGGEGKTTLAVELARWLVRTRRYKRVVFICMENIYDVRTVVDIIGRQLLPNFSVAQYDSTEKALPPIEKQLGKGPTLMVLDNMESILPPREKNGTSRLDAPALEEFFTLCSRLTRIAGTHLLFTSREALPKPFASGSRTISLSRMDKRDAVALVHRTMMEAGEQPLESDDGRAQPEVEALVESVHCHARSLVLLVPYINRFGVRHATENLGKIMADLHRKYGDARELSLYASVQLSLQKLDPALQQKIKPLGAFQGGINLMIIDYVLQLEEGERDTLVGELTRLNLAEPMAYGFLRFHPALCPFLWRQMTAEEQTAGRERWAQSMMQLTSFLYQQLAKDAQLSLNLTTLELPNLMGMLHHVRDKQDPETTVGLATKLEQLLSNLGRQELLSVVAGIRQEETKKLGQWSHTRFEAARAQLERLLEGGNPALALTRAQALLEKARQEGDHAYEGTDYDTAIAYFLLGRIQSLGGASEAALSQTREAYQRFQGLADQGNTSAATMAAASLTQMGDCLRNLGRLDDAASAYEEGTKRSEAAKRERDVAVGKMQLGTVRLIQKRYDQALDAYHQSREIFETLGEPAPVAAAWHQTGMVHEEAGQYEAAEQALRKALAIRVRQNNPAGEASSLNQLGLLYARMGRLEESVVFLKQAADKYAAIKDLAKEGVARSNIAIGLIKLNRYAEAREEILRAIECDKPYGHASEPWKTWAILHDLETAEGNSGAAAQAQLKAFELFLAYRKDGGENHEFGGRLCHGFRQALNTDGSRKMATELQELAKHPDLDSQDKLLIRKLQAMLDGPSTRTTGSGEAEPWLAEGLYYMDAVEIQLLMEEKEKQNKK